MLTGDKPHKYLFLSYVASHVAVNVPNKFVNVTGLICFYILFNALTCLRINVTHPYIFKD